MIIHLRQFLKYLIMSKIIEALVVTAIVIFTLYLTFRSVELILRLWRFLWK
jgi:hypothetical protein